MNTLGKSIAAILIAASNAYAVEPALAAASPNFTTNPEVSYCMARYAQHLTCTAAMYAASIGVSLQANGPTPVTIPGFNAPNYGTTVATVNAGFAANLAKVIAANPHISTQMAPGNMLPIIARLSAELAAYDKTGATTAALLKSVAQHETAATLRFYQSAFGPTLVAAALPNATAAVQASYKALPLSAALPMSAYQYALKGTKSPAIDASSSYLCQIMLILYFTSNDTLTVVMHKTQQYVHAAFPTASNLNVIMGAQPAPAGVTGYMPRPKPLAAARTQAARPDAGVGDIIAAAALVVAIVTYLDPDGGKEIVNYITDMINSMNGDTDTTVDASIWTPNTGGDEWDDNPDMGGWLFGDNGGGWDDSNDLCSDIC